MGLDNIKVGGDTPKWGRKGRMGERMVIYKQGRGEQGVGKDNDKSKRGGPKEKAANWGKRATTILVKIFTRSLKKRRGGEEKL